MHIFRDNGISHSPASDANREPDVRPALPQVRIPLRVKIAFPYILLALAFALAAAYVASRVVLDSIQERFTSQLIETGKLTSAWMVQEEDRLLETLRLLANTQGMPEAVTDRDTERLRALALPIAVNAQQETIEILDMRGTSLLSLRHHSGGNVEDYDASRGEDIFGQWAFVRQVLERRMDAAGDKYAGLARAPWGDTFYVTGPILDDEGQPVGAILVGASLPTLVRQIREDLLAHVTFYDLNGQPLASTLFSYEGNTYPLSLEMAAEVLQQQGNSSLMRDLSASGISYGEIVAPWQARGETVGLVGVAFAQTFLVHTSQITRVQIFLLVTLAILSVVGVGASLATLITHPLLRVVHASAEVAQGNLAVRLEPTGDDEVAVLAYAFNDMVSGLQEGALYRDLLGRTVSPEVREQLRRAFASGEVRLEGQEVMATVLIADIRDFTTLSEQADPTTVLAWLNEYFGEVVPIIAAHGGVVNAFVGDAIVAFFGILPQPLPPEESAYQACRAAVEMLRAIEHRNTRHAAQGAVPFVTGIGINTGRVTAGSLGTADRLHYTIIGDTVNTTQRLEGLTRQFGESGAAVSQHTLRALGERSRAFRFDSLGVHTLKGKREQVRVYRLCPSEAPEKERATA